MSEEEAIGLVPADMALSRQISVRLPVGLLGELEAMVARRNGCRGEGVRPITLTDVIRESLTRGLRDLTRPRKAKKEAT